MPQHDDLRIAVLRQGIAANLKLHVTRLGDARSGVAVVTILIVL